MACRSSLRKGCTLALGGRKSQKLIGEILVQRGIVTEEQVNECIQLQQQEGTKKLGQILIEKKHCTEKDVARALSEQTGIHMVNLAQTNIPDKAFDLIKKEFIVEHNIIPVKKKGNLYTIVMADPMDLYTLDNLRFILNADIQPLIAPPSDIRAMINKHFGISDDDIKKELEELGIEDEDVGTRGVSKETEDEGDDAPIIKMVTLVIHDAVNLKASDIHVEPMENRLRVRYRIDGICHEMKSPPKKLQGAIIGRIKIMAGIDLAEKRKPTDGRIILRVNRKQIDLRVSCLPATWGESVVMRILDKESVLVGIDNIGFSDHDLRVFRGLIKRPNGIFLVTGPTGSGKTTTLYTALQELNTTTRKIITAEEPVEYMLPGINQCEVRHNIGLDFSRILRAMLRQAPNVILVGEIRDRETAEIAIQAALTGHMVFSTLHTNDAPGAITRLVDIGVKPFLVASSIIGIMAQRLVRRICSKCKTEHANPDYFKLEAIGISQEMLKGVKIYRGAGCDKCNGTGYKGRMGVFEIMVMDSRLREMAFNGAGTHELRQQARNSGMLSLQEDGVQKVLSGQTTYEEILRVTHAQNM